MGARSIRRRRFGWGAGVLVPIHVIDPTFAGQYTSSGQPASNVCGVAVVDSSPSQVGFNGILGVGLFPFDSGFYYNCATLPCTSIAVRSLATGPESGWTSAS